MSGWDLCFGPDRPPPMPLSALLYCPTFMRFVAYHAPSMVYGIGRDARRDARQVAHWLRWAIVRWHALLLWHEMNVQPLVVQPVQPA